MHIFLNILSKNNVLYYFNVSRSRHGSVTFNYFYTDTVDLNASAVDEAVPLRMPSAALVNPSQFLDFSFNHVSNFSYFLQLNIKAIFFINLFKFNCYISIVNN